GAARPLHHGNGAAGGSSLRRFRVPLFRSRRRGGCGAAGARAAAAGKGGAAAGSHAARRKLSMDRLRDHALIYGRLLVIDEPHLIARYNRALTAFGLPQTQLARFEIDRTGFSPQVAEDLKDPDYLDPNGINRRFIILTPRQIELPVVHTAFSNTSQLMFEFLSRNARAIHAVTIKDVLFGEIEDSVSK